MQSITQMVRYYEESGPDYETWSPSFNMHFGYWGRGANPLDRESMLEAMNGKVSACLPETGRFLDMGCGLGATARAIARLKPASFIAGVTIVPWQVQMARALSAGQSNIVFHEVDYINTKLDPNSMDGVYAIESLCHGPGRDKLPCIQEAHRLLRPGSTFAVADGFLKHGRTMNRFLTACHQRICDCWTMDSLAVLPEFLEAMRQTGFQNIKVEDLSWRVAASVAHVPWVTLKFLASQLIVKRGRLSPERWNNILAPILTGIVGLARKHFGYYLITAQA
jgi:MPBQ/MSBQ methyltransferase